MLIINNINIKFSNKTILDNTSIKIHDNSITTIIGKSGSGKTSLLYCIGLLSTNYDMNYSFDNEKIDLINEKQLSLYRRYDIGFIFQDNLLVNDLTVGDNITMSAKLAGIDLVREDINEILQYVDMENSFEMYPKQLSGGEQQRIAIACALAKKPKLIVADEPTSSLDMFNTNKILNIFQKIAESGKKVVIATHNSDLINISDIVYEIKDSKLNLIKGDDNENKYLYPKQIKNKISLRRDLGLKFYLNYIRNTSKRKKIRNILLVFFCSIVISIYSISNIYFDEYITQISSQIHSLSNREIFLVNGTTPLTSSIDVDENLSITLEEITKINKTTGISKCYPFYEFRSNGYDIKTENYIDNSKIRLFINKGEKTICFGDNHYTSYTIIPYYPEQMLHKKVKNIKKDDNSIFISSDLARLLKIEDITYPIKIDVDCLVPTMQSKTQMSVGDGKAIYNIDVDLAKQVNLNLVVNGIVNDDSPNFYTNSGNNVIYIPYSKMSEILENNKNIGTHEYEYTYELKDYEPSAYMLYATTYNEVANIIDKLHMISPNFKAKSQYQDISTFNAILSRINYTSILVSTIVIVIIFIFMTIIKINEIHNRRYEIATLKANGFSKTNVLLLNCTEAAILIIKIVVLSLIFSIFDIFVLKILFYHIVNINLPKLIYQNFLVTLIPVLIPSTIALINMNKINPSHTLRK